MCAAVCSGQKHCSRATVACTVYIYTVHDTAQSDIGNSFKIHGKQVKRKPYVRYGFSVKRHNVTRTTQSRTAIIHFNNLLKIWNRIVAVINSLHYFIGKSAFLFFQFIFSFLINKIGN